MKQTTVLFFKWLDIVTIKLILNKNPILEFTGDPRFSGASMSWIPREMCWYSSQLWWLTWSVPVIPPVHFSTAVFGDLSVRKYNNCPLNTVSHTILANISKFQEGRCWTGMDVKEKLVGQICSSLKMKLITAKSCGKKARKEITPGVFCCSFLL